MAAIAPTLTRHGPDAALVSWLAVGNGDTFAPFNRLSHSGFTRRSVQITGTFGSATVVINGSIDGTTYAGLSDVQGTLVSKTAAGFEQLQDITPFVQPAKSGGTGESINVYMFLAR